MEIYKEKSRQQIRASTLVGNHANEIRELFAEGLNALGEALDADRVVGGPEGDACLVGPDHGTRLAALKVFVDVVLRSRKPPIEPPEKLPELTYQGIIEDLYGTNPEEAMQTILQRIAACEEADRRRREEQKRSEEQNRRRMPPGDVLRP